MLSSKVAGRLFASLYFFQPQLRPDWLTTLFSDLGQETRLLPITACSKTPAPAPGPPGACLLTWATATSLRPPAPAPAPRPENRQPGTPGAAPGAIAGPRPVQLQPAHPRQAISQGDDPGQQFLRAQSRKSARLRASSTRNAPTARRRRAVRCAPHPRASPKSCGQGADIGALGALHRHGNSGVVHLVHGQA